MKLIGFFQDSDRKLMICICPFNKNVVKVSKLSAPHIGFLFFYVHTFVLQFELIRQGKKAIH